MIIRINEIDRDEYVSSIIYGKTYFQFDTKLFEINWFKDSGEWFLYFRFMKYYMRFSSAGFMKGRIKWQKDG